MASQKVRLRVSIKELAIEFEGDQETARSIQERISDTLESVSRMPQVIDADYRRNTNKVLSPPPEAQPQSSPKMPKRKKAGKRRSEADKSATDDGEIVSRSARTKRPKGGSVRDLIIGLLRDTNFFNHKKEASEIKQELSKSGHNFEANEISAPLTPLTKKRYLSREQNENGRWVYSKGTNNDYGGS